MNIRISFLLMIFSFVISIPNVNAQDAQLFFTGVKPQENLFNPSVHYDSTVLIISPFARFRISNNSFGFNDAFVENNLGAKYWDIDYMIKNAKDENLLNLDLNYSFLFFNKKIKKDFYATFSINQNNSYNFLLPKDLFELSKGNISYQDETTRNFDLKGLAINSYSYTSFSTGLIKKISPVFTLGTHVKLLRGHYLTQTNKFEALLNTRGDLEETYLEADINFRQSAPLMYGFGSPNNTYGINDFPGQFFWHNNLFKNLGAAFDIGFTYSPENKTTFSGSVSDIGFICWNQNQAQIKIKGNYTFGGLDISPDAEGKINIEESFNTLMDTLNATFDPQTNDSTSFTTYLPSKIYFGMKRKINEKFDLFGVFRATISSFYNDYRYTLGTIYKPKDWLLINLTTSYKNKTFGNLGAGFIFNFKRIQFFVVTENIDFTLFNSRSVNVAAGLNYDLLSAFAPR
ncbi:MAG TPA: DUF5723 family protein [Draconibacterium sp.]|nr:DUF5723 family protein [Draconibacterium sp.]